MFLFKKKAAKKKLKTKDSLIVLERLNSYLNTDITEPVQFLVNFWEDQKNAITYKEIRQAILDGFITEDTLNLWMQDYSVLVSEKMVPLWMKSLSVGSVGQPIMDKLATSFTFDINTPSVKSWINERGAQFVTAVTTEQKGAIKALLSQYETGTYTVDELSRVIRPCIGLTKQQSEANLKYYNNVKNTLTKDHPRMKPESIEKKAHEAAIKYAEKQHRQRAFDIAQTETAFAYNKGADKGIRQAQSQNLLGVMEKRWSTSGDESVCKICAALDGVQIKMDEEFNFKGKVLYAGQKLTPPAHPKCACAVQYIEVSPPMISSFAREMDGENADYLIRNHVPGENTTDERIVVNEAISEVPEKVQQIIHDGTIIDVGKIGASQYDYNNDILYVAKGAEKEAVIHEIGHLVENKMLDAKTVSMLREEIVGDVTPFDICKQTYYNSSGDSIDIFVLNNSRFVSEYQGRIYVDDILDAFDIDGKFKTELLWEFIAEPFREYMKNPLNLKKNHKEFYDLLKGVLE